MSKIRKTNIFTKWFSSLRNKKAKVIIDDKIQRIEEDGYIGATKPIIGVKNISEIKIDIGKGYRIYFNIYIKGNEVWLLNGSDKSTQDRDIKIAQKLLEEIQNERKENEKDYNNSRRC